MADMTLLRRLAFWLVVHVPLGDLAPWVLGYAVMGEWGEFQKVKGEGHDSDR